MKTDVICLNDQALERVCSVQQETLRVKVEDAVRNLWTDDRPPEHWQLGRLVALPVGYVGRLCPKCQSQNISGAIIRNCRGMLAIQGTDAADPNLLCLACNYWADSFPPSKL